MNFEFKIAQSPILVTNSPLEGLFLIILPIALVIVGFLTNEIYWWIWTLSIICLIIGIVFLVGQYIIRVNEYNNFLKLQNELKKKLTKRR